MANGNDGANVYIDIGVDVESSYTLFKQGLDALVAKFAGDPPKIKVELDLSAIKTSSMRAQIEKELSGKTSSGKVSSVIDSEALTKAAEGAKNASDEISRLKTETQGFNSTLNTASKRLDAFNTKLTQIKNSKTGETAISQATKQLIDLQAKINEINSTNAGIKKQYFGLKSDLGGEAATGQNAEYVEQLKNKYLELMNVVELVKTKGASASAEEIQNIYNLQGETEKLIAKIQEKIVTEQQESAQVEATNRSESEYVRLLKEATNLQARYQNVLRNSSKAEFSAKSSEHYENLKKNLTVLTSLIDAYKGNTTSEDELSNATKRLSLELSQNYGAIKNNGDATKTFSERIGSLAEKFGYWFSITRVIMAVYRAMKQMVSASIELDDAMTQLQIVTKDSEETYERFGNKIADTAKKIGSSISDLLDSTTVYARLGYSLDESSSLAEYTAMLQNVGNIDVSDAQDAITAIVKAFDVDVDEIESIMDKLVATGNNFPISVAQIAEGMNNASSALAAAGNTFEQSVALLTAANTTIQDAAKSSTGLRTIAARIRNTKTELDELGEEMSEASYEELVQQLTDFNVALTTANGEYRSTYDIMYDIAQRWSKMTSMEKAALATAMSGTRQQAVFYSIIEQFQEATGAMDEMSNSAGELQKSYDIYMESTTAHINQFKAAFQELGADTFDSEFLQQFIDLGTHIIELLDGLAGVVDAIGGLNTVLNITIILLATINGGKIWARMKDAYNGIVNLTATLSGLKARLADVYYQNGTLSQAFNAVGASAYAANIAIGAVTAAIIVAISLYKSYKEHLENVAKQTEEMANKAESATKKLIDLKAQLESGTSSTEELTEAFKEQLRQMGYTNDEIDGLINKYHGLAGAIDEVTETEARRALAAAKANVNAQYKAAKGASIGISDTDNGIAPFAGMGGSDGIYVWASPNLKQYVNEVSSLNTLLNDIDLKTGEGLREYYNELLRIRGLLYDDAMSDESIYDDYFFKNIEKYISSIEEQYGAYLESLETVDEVTEIYKDVLGAVPEANAEALLSPEQFKKKAAEVAESVKKTFDEIFVTEGNEKTAFSEYLNTYIDEVTKLQTALSNFRDGKLAPEDMLELQTAFPELAVGSEKFEQAIISLIETMRQGANVELDSAIDGITDPENLAKIAAIRGNIDELAVVSEKAAESVVDLSDALDKLDKSKDILETAGEEMAENGEISTDTLKSLVDLMEAGENYLDYLDIENGKIKLNTAAWEDRAAAQITADLADLEKERLEIEKENETLEENIAKLAARQYLLSNSGTSAYAPMKTKSGKSVPMMLDGVDVSQNRAFTATDKAQLEQYQSQLEANNKTLSQNNASAEVLEALLNNIKEIMDNAFKSGTSKGAEKKSKSESSEKEDEPKYEDFNWIEKILDRIQRKIDSFSKVVSSKFKTLSTRQEAAKKEIEAITEEIELQEQAYKKYMELANSIDITGVVSAEEWAQITLAVREGTMDISKYEESVADLIEQYTEMYEAALDCKDSVDDLHESLASMYDDEFNRIQTDFENRISLLDYLSNMYNTGISQLETEGYMASTEFYNSLTEATEHNIELLKEELNGLESALQAALDSGEIEMYSEAWYGYIVTMNGVKEAIADANLSLTEFAKTMQEIDWEYFDYLQERISGITDESEFLLELLGDDNIFKDGKLTADGLSVLGLRAMDYNVYMAQADKYAQEMAEIEQQIANDPNNRTLLDRREELLELQRQSILAAEDEKDAILELVQTAIEEELDSLKELIEAYKDALDAAKD